MAIETTKKRAGRILNNILRTIADERTEFMKAVGEDGEDKMVSKAEALVRTVYKLALGYQEEREIETSVGTVVKKMVMVPPDRHMIALIWERLEGKVGTTDEIESRSASIAERVGEQGKLRIAAAGGLEDVTSE